MKLSKRQKEELDCIKYFIPDLFKNDPITDEDIKNYFDHSERGIKTETFSKGLEALEQGRQWRGIHCGMWEEGILDGTIPYFTLLGGYEILVEGKKPTHNPIPRYIVDFMKKTLFQGNDAELIEMLYERIIKETNEHLSSISQS